jgi:hypothetical protein
MMMKWTYLSTIPAVLVAGIWLAAGGQEPAPADTQQITVQPLALLVTRQYPREEPRSQEEAFQGFYGQLPGTHVAFRLDSKDKNIIALDQDASTFSLFRDDKGTNLLKQKPRAGWIWHFPRIMRNGRTCIFEFQSPLLPAAGAKTLELKGELVLHTGSGEASTSVTVALGQKQQVDIGGRKITVSYQRFANRSVELSGDKHLGVVKGASFLDGKGEQIEQRVLFGDSRWGPPGGYTYTRTYKLKTDARAVTVKLSCYAKVERMTVPLSQTLGVGL